MRALALVTTLSGLAWWAGHADDSPASTGDPGVFSAALDAITSAAPMTLSEPSASGPAGSTPHLAKARALLERAERLAPSAWNPIIPEEDARPPMRLRYTERGELVVDERVKDWFAYFMSTLAATVGPEEAASRLLDALSTMPEPGRAHMRRLLEGYLAAESALEAHARDVRTRHNGLDTPGMLARLQAAGQTNDAQARHVALHETYLAAQRFQNEREQIIATHGGDEVVDLYAAMNQRAHQELALTLSMSQPGIDTRTRLSQGLAAYGLKPQQTMDEPTGMVRLAYASLDVRAIDHDPTLSAAEKQQLRLEFFGSAYVEEQARLHPSGR